TTGLSTASTPAANVTDVSEERRREMPSNDDMPTSQNKRKRSVQGSGARNTNCWPAFSRVPLGRSIEGCPGQFVISTGPLNNRCTARCYIRNNERSRRDA